MTPAEEIKHWMDTATRRGEELVKANKRIAELEAGAAFHAVAVSQRDAAWLEIADLKQKLSGANEALAEQAVLQDPDPLAEMARAAEGKK